MPTYKLVIQYDGRRYAGWQIQPSLPTVQGELLSRLRRICNDPGLLAAGAARTDAGTHALGQVATFSTEREWEPGRLGHVLNRLLPRDIAVAGASLVPAGFHARRSATGRIYRYQIATGPVLSPFIAPWAHHFRGRLDAGAMRRGARELLGEHDFSSFRAAGDVSASTVKTMRSIEIETREDLVTITVEGSSFLQHMVRTMAGTLLEIGRGRWPPSRAGAIVEARERSAAGPTLPAGGLFLVEVLYGARGAGSLPAA